MKNNFDDMSHRYSASNEADSKPKQPHTVNTEEEKEEMPEKKIAQSAKGMASLMRHTQTAIKGVRMVQMVQALHSLWQNLCTFMSQLLAAVKSLAYGAVQAVMTFAATSFAATMITSFGVIFVIIAASFGAVAATGAIISHAQETSDMEKNDPIPNGCAEELQKKLELDGSLEGADADVMIEENARKVYSFFKNRGLTNEQISGILGCWQAECGLDPTTIEGYYADKYVMSAKKQEIFKNLHSHTQQLFDQYASSGLAINHAGYTHDGKYYCGLGLAQWTGPGAATFIGVANSADQDWYSMEFQLAYSVSKHYRPGFFSLPEWEAAKNSVDQATDVFMRKYEGVSASGYLEKRQGFARTWYSKMKNWSVDKAYAESILGILKDDIEPVLGQSANSAYKDCQTGDLSGYSNESIAQAGASMAWPTRSDAYNNYGTSLYQKVVESVIPARELLANTDSTGAKWKGRNCTVGAAAAIRWAGGDDNFPHNWPEDQKAYCENSPRWKKVTSYSRGSVPYDLLKPGDVMICVTPGGYHICIYTGEEALIEHCKGYEAGSGFDSTHAAWYPSVATSYSYFAMKTGTFEEGEYHVYRNIKPEENSKYKNAVNRN